MFIIATSSTLYHILSFKSQLLKHSTDSTSDISSSTKCLVSCSLQHNKSYRVIICNCLYEDWMYYEQANTGFNDLKISIIHTTLVTLPSASWNMISPSCSWWWVGSCWGLGHSMPLVCSSWWADSIHSLFLPRTQTAPTDKYCLLYTTLLINVSSAIHNWFHYNHWSCVIQSKSLYCFNPTAYSCLSTLLLEHLHCLP